jgi:hypothetical protein
MDHQTRLQRRINHDFPESGSAQEILRILDELPDVAGYDREILASERVHAAIIILANGTIKKFRNAIELATTDWRDLLVAAGLAHEDWPTQLDNTLGPERPGP